MYILAARFVTGIGMVISDSAISLILIALVVLIVLVVLVLLGHSVHLPSWTTGRLAIAAYAPIDVHS